MSRIAPTFAALAAIVNIRALGVAFSIWGQKATGLPIDFQVQSVTEGNAIEGKRHALGIRELSA